MNEDIPGDKPVVVNRDSHSTSVQERRHLTMVVDKLEGLRHIQLVISAAMTVLFGVSDRNYFLIACIHVSSRI
jgi:hypothetical protein